MPGSGLGALGSRWCTRGAGGRGGQPGARCSAGAGVVVGGRGHAQPCPPGESRPVCMQCHWKPGLGRWSSCRSAMGPRASWRLKEESSVSQGEQQKWAGCWGDEVTREPGGPCGLVEGPGAGGQPPQPYSGLVVPWTLRGSSHVPRQQVRELLEPSTRPAGQRGSRSLRPETSLAAGFQCLRCGPSPGT